MRITQSIEGISIFTGSPIRIEYCPDGIENIVEVNYVPGMCYLSPGFLDIQVNGYNGIDYSLENLNSKNIKSLVQHLAVSGTTKHVPTFVTMPQNRLLNNLRTVSKAMHSDSQLATSIPGFHIEGPFISPLTGPRGVHDPKYIRTPNYSDFLEWQNAAEGKILYVTIAPEVEGALDFISKVVKSGVKVAIGHSAASPEVINEAIGAGATLSTHLGNGSFTEIHRLRNYIWEQLAADGLTAGIICDGHHLPPSVVKVFTRAKGLDRLILVSDVALLGGFPEGQYKWGNMDIDVHADGHLGLHGSDVLAGAAHTLDWDIARFIEYTGSTLAEAIGLCTINPAKALKINSNQYESFSEGNPSNFCKFSYEYGIKRLDMREVIQHGSVLFKK